MKIALFFIRIYLRILGAISPKLAARKAFNIFQKVRNKQLRKREHAFYAAANTFTAEWEREDITCYEIGNPNGELVLLVHGWDSNVGSLGSVGFELARKGYHVIGFNLPGHGFSKLKYSNILINAEAFHAVVNRIRPGDPFSVVSHSFGSAVTSFALNKYGHQVDQLVFLTTPNQIRKVFEEYRDLVKMPALVFSEMVRYAENLVGAPLEEMTVAKLIQEVKYRKLTLIHDSHDKIIPFERSLQVYEAAENAELIELKKAGHYRMLWTNEVVEMVAEKFPGKANTSQAERPVLMTQS